MTKNWHKKIPKKRKKEKVVSKWKGEKKPPPTVPIFGRRIKLTEWDIAKFFSENGSMQKEITEARKRRYAVYEEAIKMLKIADTDLGGKGETLLDIGINTGDALVRALFRRELVEGGVEGTLGRKIVAYLKKTPEGRLGSEKLREWLRTEFARNLKLQVIGVDIAFEPLLINPLPTVMKADAQSIPLKNNSTKYALVVYALNEMLGGGKLQLKELARVMKDKGRAVVVMPVEMPKKIRKMYEDKMREYFNVQHSIHKTKTVRGQPHEARYYVLTKKKRFMR
jgi:hypothetical protein